MYQTLYGTEDVREIINQVNQVKTLDEKLKASSKYKNRKEKVLIYQRCMIVAQQGEWYISQRLETKI